MERNSARDIIRLEIVNKENEILRLKRVIENTPVEKRKQLHNRLEQLRKEKTELYKKNILLTKNNNTATFKTKLIVAK
jgi:hypothetical protein